VLRADGVSPSSIGDDEVGGYLAVRQLIDLDHRNIAVVAAPSFTSSAVGLLAGARRAFAEAGITPPEKWMLAAGYSIENGYTAGESILRVQAADRPTAVFAANDNIAMGIIAAAHRFNISIGQDLALVGYNDTPLSARLPIPLSSVRVPLAQIAGTAIDLITTLRKEPYIFKSMPTPIPRTSSGSPRHFAARDHASGRPAPAS
jgi:LacI family transcriptional regulator